MTVGINYDTDINTVKKILNDTVMKVAGVEPEPKPITLVRELGTQAEIKLTSVPQLKVIQFTDSGDRTDNSDNRKANSEQSN